MPSTRKQRANEKCSRHSDLMSEIGYLDVMLENLTEKSPENGHKNERSEIDTASAGLQENTNTLADDFKSLLNGSSRRNSVSAVETVRIINEELITQISRKLDEIKRGRDSRILISINTAITEKVIPGMQESIDTLENRLTAKLDLQSGGLDRNTEGFGTGKLAAKQSKLNRNVDNLSQNVCKGDLEPISNDRNYDTVNKLYYCC